MLGHRLSMFSHCRFNCSNRCSRSVIEGSASEENNEERPGLKRNSSVSWGRFDMINETVDLM